MNSVGLIAIVFAAIICAPAAAQTKDEKAKQTARAKERCKANRGADCDTREGLREWLLQERSRSEALREGSRHRLPSQSTALSPKP